MAGAGTHKSRHHRRRSRAVGGNTMAVDGVVPQRQGAAAPSSGLARRATRCRAARYERAGCGRQACLGRRQLRRVDRPDAQTLCHEPNAHRRALQRANHGPGDTAPVETEAMSPSTRLAEACYLEIVIVPFASFCRGRTVMLYVTSRANPLDASPPAKRIVCLPTDRGGSSAQ